MGGNMKHYLGLSLILLAMFYSLHELLTRDYWATKFVPLLIFIFTLFVITSVVIDSFKKEKK
jgi:hypothetical protein